VAQTRLFTRNYTLVCFANFSFWAGIYCFLGSVALYVVQLGGTAFEAGLATGAVPLTSFFTQVAFARAIARWPRVRVLAAAPGVLLVGAAIAAAASSPLLLVVASCVIGTGYTTFQTAATTLAADVTPPARRGEALGVYGSFTTVSLAIGPALGIGLLTGFGPWAALVAGAALGLVAIALGLAVREPARREAPPLARAAKLDPIIYYCMFVNAGMTFTHGALIALLPLYARSIGMENPGLFYTVFAIAAVGIRAYAGRLSDRLGRIQVLLPATVLLALALLSIAAGPPPAVLLAIAVVYAVGYASLHPTNLAFAVDRASAAARPLALSIVNSGFALGMGTGAIGMGALLAATSFAATFAVAGLIPLGATSAFLVRYAMHRPPRIS
jgi:MFS family permease